MPIFIATLFAAPHMGHYGLLLVLWGAGTMVGLSVWRHWTQRKGYNTLWLAMAVLVMAICLDSGWPIVAGLAIYYGVRMAQRRQGRKVRRVRTERQHLADYHRMRGNA